VVFDAALTGTFVVTLKRFIEYDAQTDLFVLGPTSSGKSLLLLGSYYQAVESADGNRTPDANTDLYWTLGEIDNNLEQMDPPKDVWWPLAANDADEVREIGFEFVYGNAFPKNVSVKTIDYAGEWLELIPDILSLEGSDLNDYIDNRGFSKYVIHEIKSYIQLADMLVLIIDVEKHVSGDDIKIDTYNQIAQSNDSKKILLVATKADFLIEPFQRETGLDPIEEYDEFQEYVTETLSSRGQVRSIVDRASGSTIHPVWYQTQKLPDEDKRVPSLTETNDMVPVGFDRLLDHFGRGR
jgi:GTPase SAR1 family protein